MTGSPLPHKLTRRELHKRYMDIEKLLVLERNEVLLLKAALAAGGDAVAEAYRRSAEHPNRIETMLKDWMYVCNKFNIGMAINAPQVAFVCGGFTLTTNFRELLSMGMQQILEALAKLPSTSVPPSNRIDGKYYEHPDIVKDKREVAMQEACRTLIRAGVPLPTEIAGFAPLSED